MNKRKNFHLNQQKIYAEIGWSFSKEKAKPGPLILSTCAWKWVQPYSL